MIPASALPRRYFHFPLSISRFPPNASRLPLPASQTYNVRVPAETVRLSSPQRLPRLWLIIPAACLVPAVLDAFQTYMQRRIGRPYGTSWGDVVFSGIEWLFLGALTPITYQLAKRFPIRRETLRRTLGVHVIGSLILCVGWATAGVALRYVLGMVPAAGLRSNLASWLLTSLPWSVFMYFAVLGSIYAFMYFTEAREREAQSARLSAQLAEARLGALRMQLNPHFLFNSLNAIGVLVRDQNTTAASRMLELLGDVLHSVLRSDARAEIPLSEEIQFLEQYLAIEQVRFSDRLRVTWSIDDRLRSALVPGFILQPLVENALRHGVAKRSDLGTIEVAATLADQTLVLSVIDNGPGLGASETESGGVGLANIRERLRTMYGPSASLSLESRGGDGTVATIRLPYHEAPNA
jgi:two-component system, LytTR family, sensor kinase